MARLKDLYKSKIVAELTKQFGYGSPMAVPHVEKVVVSMGVGKATQDKKYHRVSQERADDDYRPVACRLQSQEKRLQLQAPSRHGDWSESYSSRRKNVRVFG